MTSSIDQSDRDLIEASFAAALIGAGAIVLEHLAATEISQALHIPREWDKRFGQILGTATIFACYTAVARSGVSRSQQIAALGIVISGCGAAAIGCSAVRWRVGGMGNARTGAWRRPRGMGGRMMALNPGALACELIELVECWAADLHEDLSLLETLAETATTDGAAQARRDD